MYITWIGGCDKPCGHKGHVEFSLCCLHLTYTISHPWQLARRLTSTTSIGEDPGEALAKAAHLSTNPAACFWLPSNHCTRNVVRQVFCFTASMLRLPASSSKIQINKNSLCTHVLRPCLVPNFFQNKNSTTFVCIWQILSKHVLIRLKRFVSSILTKLCN